MQRGIDYSFYGKGNMQSKDLMQSIKDGIQIGKAIRGEMDSAKASAQAESDNAARDEAFSTYMQDPKNRDNMMNLYKADSKLATGLFGIVSAGDKEEAMKMKEASMYAEKSYTNIYASLQQGDFDSAKMQALQLRGEFESRGFDIKPLEDIETAQSPEQAMSIAQTKRALAGATLKVVDPLTLDQAADNERADRELALKANDQEFNQNLGVAKFGETQRSNRTSESIARGNLSVNHQRLQQQNSSDNLRAQELQLDRDKFNSSKTKLSANAEKALMQSQDSAQSSRTQAGELKTLAAEFDNLSANGGSRARLSESLKEFAGTENAVTDLRKKYNRIRNAQVMKSLPPGVASDKDIEIAMSGFPKGTSNPEHVASFLRGMSKMEEFSADFEEFKSNYISENGNTRRLIQAWKKQVSTRTSQLGDQELFSKYGIK